LGMAPWLAQLVWKPVAVIAIFVAARAYYHRALAGTAQRRAALVLGLFAAGWASLGEQWIPFLAWGARWWSMTAPACSVKASRGRHRS
jgi:hypothetical protein